MADSFNEAIKVEDELVEREVRLAQRALKAGKPCPDYEPLHANLVRIGIGKGMTKKGAQAWATLQVLDIKRRADTPE